VASISSIRSFAFDFSKVRGAGTSNEKSWNLISSTAAVRDDDRYEKPPL